MIEIAPIDELREVRRKLSEEQSGDVEQYAAMLRQVSKAIPGRYITAPLSYADDARQPQTVEA